MRNASSIELFVPMIMKNAVRFGSNTLRKIVFRVDNVQMPNWLQVARLRDAEAEPGDGVVVDEQAHG